MEGDQTMQDSGISGSGDGGTEAKRMRHQSKDPASSDVIRRDGPHRPGASQRHPGLRIDRATGRGGMREALAIGTGQRINWYTWDDGPLTLHIDHAEDQSATSPAYG